MKLRCRTHRHTHIALCTPHLSSLLFQWALPPTGIAKHSFLRSPPSIPLPWWPITLLFHGIVTVFIYSKLFLCKKQLTSTSNWLPNFSRKCRKIALKPLHPSLQSLVTLFYHSPHPNISSKTQQKHLHSNNYQLCRIANYMWWFLFHMCLHRKNTMAQT